VTGANHHNPLTLFSAATLIAFSSFSDLIVGQDILLSLDDVIEASAKNASSSMSTYAKSALVKAKIDDARSDQGGSSSDEEEKMPTGVERDEHRVNRVYSNDESDSDSDGEMKNNEAATRGAEFASAANAPPTQKKQTLISRFFGGKNGKVKKGEQVELVGLSLNTKLHQQNTAAFFDSDL
jgi:hypothetical protein